MGQSYSVEANLRFKNDEPSGFCNAIVSSVNPSADKLAKYDTSDPLSCFRLVTTDKAIIDGAGIYQADFDGSYGWETVLVDAFRKASPYLKNGSWIEVYVWEGNGASHSFAIEDGRVSESYMDYDETEEVAYLNNIDNKIYTHDEALEIVKLFDDVLTGYGICVPSPEDDERGSDNMIGLYGTTFADLFDDVETMLLNMLSRHDNGAEVVPFVFSGTL